MSTQNEDLASALGKLGITLDHSRFQSLPAARDSLLWNDFKNPPFGLNAFELGALKNARCGDTSSQLSQSGTYLFPIMYVVLCKVTKNI